MHISFCFYLFIYKCITKNITYNMANIACKHDLQQYLCRIILILKNLFLRNVLQMYAFANFKVVFNSIGYIYDWSIELSQLYNKNTYL